MQSPDRAAQDVMAIALENFMAALMDWLGRIELSCIMENRRREHLQITTLSKMEQKRWIQHYRLDPLPSVEL